MVILNKMSTNYYSSVDHPHPFYSPSPVPQTEQIPTWPRYAPSPIPFIQSPLPMSEKSSSPKIVSIQHNHAVQTDPTPFPHPLILAKSVREHFPQPEQFLKVFHSTLDSLYMSSPNQPKRTSPDVFREVPIKNSTPALPWPKAAFTENRSPSLEDSILLQQLLNDRELEMPILVYCQAGSLLLTLYRAYQANWRLKNIRASEQTIFEQEADLVNTCYWLGMFQFLQELHHLPIWYLKSNESFCLTCYHVRHYQSHWPNLYQSFLAPLKSWDKGVSRVNGNNWRNS